MLQALLSVSLFLNICGVIAHWLWIKESNMKGMTAADFIISFCLLPFVGLFSLIVNLVKVKS